MTARRKTRLTLGFVTPHEGREGIKDHWNVPHDPKESWHDGHEAGKALFAEVVRLAASNPRDARLAILAALNSRRWHPGYGREYGFAEALAATAVAGVTRRRPVVQPKIGERRSCAAGPRSRWIGGKTPIRAWGW